MHLSRDDSSADKKRGAPSTEKKVLFVTPVAPWKLFGGTATVSKNLIALFSETLDMSVCCLRSDEPGPYPRQSGGAIVLSGKVSGLARKLKVLWDFSSDSFAHRQFQRETVRKNFADLVAALRPEFIIFDHIFSSWLIDLVPGPTRVIYIAHDDMVAYADSLLQLGPGLGKRLRFAGLRRQYRGLQAKVLRRCEFTLAMTTEDAALLRLTARGPVEVAPLFFDFPGFVRDGSSPFRTLLVTGSFDTWEKVLGLTQFLDTVILPLLQRRPELRLIVAGRIPDEVRRQLPLAEPQLKIIHAPSEAAMREILEQASAAVVLDLQASGLKIKTVELAAAGLPIVSWAPGLEGTLLVHDQSCLRANSASEFIAHLDRLFAEPDLRHRLGTAARETIGREFSKDAALAQMRRSEYFAALASAGAVRAAFLG
jgi:glycosyltransferase involved in cell wall biosynthesis